MRWAKKWHVDTQGVVSFKNIGVGETADYAPSFHDRNRSLPFQFTLS
jgi:hypothetical protein